MLRKSLIAMALSVMAALVVTGPAPADPGPGITGNDTGGIIPYSPDVRRVYRAMAADHCARWGRLSHVTSVHRGYGYYISFVCIDRPGMIH